MTLTDLPKQLIYTDRKTLDDFLREDDLNKELYNVYLQVKDKPYYFKFDAVKAFNEAYYIAVLAMNERKPESQVKEWYWNAQSNIGWVYAANLVMSMVYAILSLQENKPKRIDKVLEVMQSMHFSKEHFPAFKKMAEQEIRRFNSDLTIHLCPVDKIDNIFNDDFDGWFDLTDDFDQSNIRKIVSLYPSKEERLKLIDLIEKRQSDHAEYTNRMQTLRQAMYDLSSIYESR